MIRPLILATAIAAGFAMPALAEVATTIDPKAPAAMSAALTNAAAERQAQLILAGNGYVNISALERDETGRWFGTATKDGKPVIVAINMPRRPAGVATN